MSAPPPPPLLSAPAVVVNWQGRRIAIPFARTRSGWTFMNKLLSVAALVVAAAAAAPLSAQDPSRLYSSPSLPPREALDRLRLKTAWVAQVPTDGRRDGIYSVQLVPRRSGQELLVQTRSGGVLSLDPETGQVRWSTRVGTPYRVAQPLAYNDESVFVINNIDLYALDRNTGRAQWQFQMPNGATAPPVADDKQIYLSLTNGRFEAYELPNLALWAKLAREGKVPGMKTELEASRVRKGIDVPAIGPLAGAREAYRAAATGPQPEQVYSYPPDDKVESVPLEFGDRVLLPGAGGEVAGVTKGAAKPAWLPLKARGKIAVPAGQHDDMAYVASSDGNVYAMSITSGRLSWRFVSGGTPSDRPVVLDDDVYVAVDRAGMYRVRRASGAEVWRNDDASRFLSANKNFVYAADRHGRLLVLDRARGTTLSTYDGTRDFVFPIQNDLTDRVFLAAHNGLIVCLRDRDADKPVVMKTVKERTPLPPGKPGDGGKPPADGGKPGDGGKPKPPDGAGPMKP
jgi:outer membrane protein assembly factor BamB